MKLFTTTFVLAFAVFSQLCWAKIDNDSITRANNDLKVISYNIWNGFDWGKDITRKNNFIEWVKQRNPDVMALQELCGYTKERLLKDAKKWGHNYAKILKTEGYPVGITSKKPIEVKERVLNNMHHGFLHCKTYGIDFFVIHFSPFSHKKRHEEANAVLERLSIVMANQKKYMVLGDFNAVSPFDAQFYKENDGMLESMKASEKEHSHVRNLFNNELEYGVISKLLGFPLIDVTQKHTTTLSDRISYPTQVFETKKGEGPYKNSTRIDYILVSPFLSNKCLTAKVLNKEATYYLSDHYPVVAKFSMTN